jgi:hypothetical protein
MSVGARRDIATKQDAGQSNTPAHFIPHLPWRRRQELTEARRFAPGARFVHYERPIKLRNSYLDQRFGLSEAQSCQG